MTKTLPDYLRGTVRDKPGGLFVFALCQMLVVLAKFSDELLQLLALGVLLHLHNPSVRTIEVRIPPG